MDYAQLEGIQEGMGASAACLEAIFLRLNSIGLKKLDLINLIGLNS
jgi:hypothetical protein